MPHINSAIPIMIVYINYNKEVLRKNIHPNISRTFCALIPYNWYANV